MLTPDRVAVPGGTTLIGSDADYPEEAPAFQAVVGDLCVDRTPVTNAAFAAFVAATGHVTVAERPPSAAELPGVDPVLLVPGSLVVVLPDGPVDLRVPSWWRWVPGASWRCPEGPGSRLAGREQHPVVHVAEADARAYAAWAGADLPTEQEWERAARGGTSTRYAWGEEPLLGERAHTWPGEFPGEPSPASEPFAGYFTVPVGSYPANGYGLLDMIGNVWEWTSSPWQERRAPSCCGPVPVGAPGVPKVLKGGSFLCAANSCARYRPSARVPQSPDTSTSHTGFRCVTRQAP